MTNKMEIVGSRMAAADQVEITRIGDFIKELGIIDARYIINIWMAANL